MLKILKTRFLQGCRTLAFPKRLPPVLPERYRGRPIVAGQEALDLGKMTFIPDTGIEYSRDYRMAVSSRDALILKGDGLVLASRLRDEMFRVFGRSLKLRQVSAGGCNACELDINVLNTPVFDLSRFGVQF
ncbi:MAG: hydrogenase, partial [Candidatus Omnitrophica bacterium]|nr:hydrogenase [Candidatus Omnitrophota bacterium]